jgi:hypothetical protein
VHCVARRRQPLPSPPLRAQAVVQAQAKAALPFPGVWRWTTHPLHPAVHLKPNSGQLQTFAQNSPCVYRYPLLRSFFFLWCLRESFCFASHYPLSIFQGMSDGADDGWDEEPAPAVSGAVDEDEEWGDLPPASPPPKSTATATATPTPSSASAPTSTPSATAPASKTRQSEESKAALPAASASSVVVDTSNAQWIALKRRWVRSLVCFVRCSVLAQRLRFLCFCSESVVCVACVVVWCALIATERSRSARRFHQTIVL